MIEYKFGFIIAPVFGAMSGALVLVLASGFSSLNASHLDLFFLVFLFSSAAGIMSALLFGWPISIFFRRYGLTKSRHYLIGGALCAVPAAIVIQSVASIYALFVGMLSGYYYWWGLIRSESNNK